MFQHKNQYADRLEYGNICNIELDFYCVFPLIKIKKRYSNFCGYKSRILTNFLEEKSYSMDK